MKLNKLIRMKNDKVNFVLMFTEQELEDVLSAFGMAIPLAEAVHGDSPKFRKSLNKINRGLWAAVRERHRKPTPTEGDE